MLSNKAKTLFPLLIFLVLVSCQSAAPRQLDPQQLEPPTESSIPPDIAVPTAFEEENPQSRRMAVLAAIRGFLLDSRYIDAPDSVMSETLTDLAFSSEHLTLSDPAFVRRYGSYAIVAIPDGLGLYFYDLAVSAHTPIELSRWTAGIQTLDVTWQNDKAGIIYHTMDLNGIRHAHASLVTMSANSDWTQSWISDDEPDWWFNATNAIVELAPDLSQLSVVGESTSTSQAFDKNQTSPQRLFRLLWELDGARYQVTTPSAAFRDRGEWAWATAVPSSYATLVEFVERFQRNDRAGARRLVSSDAVMADANNFGLAFSGIPYKVESLDETHLLITGYQGELILTFQPPQPEEERWIITNIAPQGAATP